MAEKPVTAAELDRWVTLQAQVPADAQGRDANAEPGDGWTTVWEGFVGIEPLTATAQLLARQVVSSATDKVRMRWRQGMSGRMRWLYEGRKLYVQGKPQEIGRKQGLWMFAAEHEGG